MALFELLRNEPDVRAFAAGEIIFAEGQAGDCMYVVLGGQVEIKNTTRLSRPSRPAGYSARWPSAIRNLEAHPRSPRPIAVSLQSDNAASHCLFSKHRTLHSR